MDEDMVSPWAESLGMLYVAVVFLAILAGQSSILREASLESCRGTLTTVTCTDTDEMCWWILSNETKETTR